MEHSRVRRCKITPAVSPREASVCKTKACGPTAELTAIVSYQQESAGVLETELRRFLRLEGVEEMEIDKLLHWEYLPELAPVISPDPPEPVCCTQFERCKGCPYPAHGFLCWGQDGECLRTMTEKKERK